MKAEEVVSGARECQLSGSPLMNQNVKKLICCSSVSSNSGYLDVEVLTENSSMTGTEQRLCHKVIVKTL